MDVLTTALTGTIGGALGYLVGKLIEHWLGKASVEHQIRFARLHDRRIDALATIYELLADADWHAKVLTSQTVSADADLVVKATEARSALAKLYFRLEKSKIFFPANLCTLVDEFIMKVDNELGELHLLVLDDAKSQREGLPDDTRKALLRANKFVSEKVPAMRSEIEREFRALLAGS